MTSAAGLSELGPGSDILDDERTNSARSSIMPTLAAHRDSNVSVSKFNRWIVGERARDSGDQGRAEFDSLKSLRQSAQESHRQYGASLGAASRAQMQRDKQQYDATRRLNQYKGSLVRDDVSAQKSEAARLRLEWVDYGRQLAEKRMEQRERIRQVTGEGSKRVQDLVAQAKFEEQEYEAELEERRAEILRSNQQEVARVKEETADSVIDASKQFALDRRRTIATKTKEDIDGWKSERGKNTADHLKQARANREDAKASRAKAKQLREQIVRERQKEAGQARDLRNRNKLAKDQQLLESGAGVKAVHDGIYRAKYVPSDSADLLNTSKYGKSTSA